MTTFFENSSVSVALDESVPCLAWIATQNPTTEEFKESEYKSLEAYRQYKTKHPKLEWLVDARKVSGLDPDITDWAAKEILPQFEKAGLKKEAFLIPADIFGQVTIDDFVNTATTSIEFKLFKDPDEAKKWLSD